MDEISYKLADMMNKRKSEESMENRAGLKKEISLFMAGLVVLMWNIRCIYILLYDCAMS